jgi:hypothetical protein
MLTEHHPSHLN